jgi:hypothetical protein
MEAIYHTSVNELSIDFLEMLKKQFANAKVDIVVRQSDDTDYLNSSVTNRKYLEKAIAEVENSKLIHKSIEELEL